MNKSLVHFMIRFPSDCQSPIPCNPGNGTFDLPPVLISPKASSVLNFLNPKVAGWSNQFDALASKIFSQTVGVIRFITNQSFRFAGQMLDCFPDQYLLMRSGRVKGHCQRNSLAVRHHHELRTPASPRNFDCRYPRASPWH